MTTILNGAYEIGSDPWDTGYCQEEDCGARLSHDERVEAILNVINFGAGYWCAACTDRLHTELLLEAEYGAY